jgi:hypothetical protein
LNRGLVIPKQHTTLQRAFQMPIFYYWNSAIFSNV